MASLAQQYARWESYEAAPFADDELELDLDAISGPADEVARIRENWKQQDALLRRQPAAEASAAAGTQPAGRPPEAGQPEIVKRPLCVQDPSVAAKMRETARKWDAYDAEHALLELDNADRMAPEDAPQVVTQSEGRIDIGCVDYKIDREEHDLDRDLDASTQKLKSRTSHYFRAAHACKEEGNALLRRGDPSGAAAKYAEGTAVVEQCLTVSVLMAPSMAEKVASLAVALHSNRAQACLQLERWGEALSEAASALELDAGHEKSRYRRAVACCELADYKASIADINLLPLSNPAGKALRKRVDAACCA